MNAQRISRSLIWLVLLLAGAVQTDRAAAEQVADAMPQRTAALRSGDSGSPDVPLPGNDVRTLASVTEDAAPPGRAEAAVRRPCVTVTPLGSVLLRHVSAGSPPGAKQRLIRAGLLASRLGTPPPVLR